MTGGIGSGKSTVLRMLQEKGVPTLQADHVAHRLLENNFVKNSIFKTFGNKIADKRGKIIRYKLASYAFRNRKNQKLLNRILHPLVWKNISVWMKKERGRWHECSVVVIEVPLLFETGYNRFFDAVISISAFPSIRRKRLLKMGWGKWEIIERESLQWTQERKDKLSTWVISNNGPKIHLKRAVDKWLRMVQRNKKI